jgi:hypothetical protein
MHQSNGYAISLALRPQVSRPIQNILAIGEDKVGRLFYKTHPPNHHSNVRAEFLTKVQYLAEVRRKQSVNGKTTAPQTQIAKLQGCVSLPKKSTYVQKPTYASLVTFSKGEFKSPHGRFSVTKPT